MITGSYDNNPMPTVYQFFTEIEMPCTTGKVRTLRIIIEYPNIHLPSLIAGGDMLLANFA